jgi:hypothetical protein
MTRALLVALFAAQAAIPPAAQPPQEAAKASHIRGRVVSAENGRPLGRARISLVSAAAPGRPLMTTSTNSQGNYDLTDVPPGSYFVSAARAGYLTLEYGQRRTSERGTSVGVRAGEVVTRIDVALVRGGVLAGRLTDENGEPYPGIVVTPWQVRYVDGRRSVFPAGTSSTDDRGDYRIAGLAPGSYTISARSAETWRNEKNEALGFSTTYYPGGAVPPATLTLEPGQQRTSLDFSLTSARTARVRGRMMLPTGEPVAGEAVQLAASVRGTGLTFAGSAPISTRTGGDGSFELREVPHGDYMLRGTVARAGSASMEITVDGDLDDLLLTPRSGSTVSGVVVTDSGEPPPFKASGMRLRLLTPEPDKVLPTVRVPAINEDWTFTLSSVGGPFFFRLSNFPAEWMLDSVRLGDDDFTDVPYNVPTGQKQIAGLRIVITKDVGKIDGTVLDAQREPTSDAIVVVFSEDDSDWLYGSRFVRSARPTATGTYSISGLPAGDYLVVAATELMEGEWESREFLKRAAAFGEKITLKRGESAGVDVKVWRAR